MQVVFALIFTALEESMDLWTAIYHCFVTCTTVGYGDVKIETDGGKLCSIVHILLSVCTITAVIADLDHLRDKRKRLLQRSRLLKRKLDRDLITSLDRDGNGLDKLEFVIGMLTKLELVTWETVEPFLQQFEMLDTDQSGKLTQDDLEKLADIFQEQVDEKERLKSERLTNGGGGSAKLRLSSALTMTHHPPRPSVTVSPAQVVPIGGAAGHVTGHVAGHVEDAVTAISIPASGAPPKQPPTANGPKLSPGSAAAAEGACARVEQPEAALEEVDAPPKPNGCSRGNGPPPAGKG